MLPELSLPTGNRTRPDLMPCWAIRCLQSSKVMSSLRAAMRIWGVPSCPGVLVGQDLVVEPVGPWRGEGLRCTIPPAGRCGPLLVSSTSSSKSSLGGQLPAAGGTAQ